MSLVWLSLAVALVAVIASSVSLTLRGLEAFRAFKALGRNVSTGVERIEQASGEIEKHLALATESGTRLDAELAQLRRSRARLNVLTSAIEDVRASFGQLAAVYPRK
jgi:hypothetical protein